MKQIIAISFLFLFIISGCKKDEIISPSFYKNLDFQVQNDGHPVKNSLGDNLRGNDLFVIFDKQDNKFKMWRTMQVNGKLGTTYAESYDGLVWEEELPFKLVLAPTPGAWDADGVETVNVLKKTEPIICGIQVIRGIDLQEN